MTHNYDSWSHFQNQIFYVDPSIHPDLHFIHEGPDVDDIAQGEAGDCWFLSSLCRKQFRSDQTRLDFTRLNRPSFTHMCGLKEKDSTKRFDLLDKDIGNYGMTRF